MILFELASDYTLKRKNIELFVKLKSRVSKSGLLFRPRHLLALPQTTPFLVRGKGVFAVSYFSRQHHQDSYFNMLCRGC